MSLEALTHALGAHVALPSACCDVGSRWEETNALAHADVASANGARKDVAQLGVSREVKTGHIEVAETCLVGFMLERRCGVSLSRDVEVR